MSVLTMTDARAMILAKLGSNPKVETVYLPPLKPDLGKALKGSDKIERFKQKLEQVHTSVDIVSSVEQALVSIISFLQRHQSPLDVAVLANVKSTLLAPVMEQNQRVNFYPCEDYAACQTLLTSAEIGVAETGSLLLPSSVQRPTLANFLPDNCIILINKKDIVAHLETGLSMIQNSDAGMPRTLNLISGPSKTADIEQTIVYGAHGPIQLHVIIYT